MHVDTFYVKDNCSGCLATVVPNFDTAAAISMYSMMKWPCACHVHYHGYRTDVHYCQFCTISGGPQPIHHMPDASRQQPGGVHLGLAGALVANLHDVDRS